MSRAGAMERDIENVEIMMEAVYATLDPGCDRSARKHLEVSLLLRTSARTNVGILLR